MSIDAKVSGVSRLNDGCYRLYLEGRKHGESPGQPFLFAKGDDRLLGLVGCCVWGGANTLMLGDEQLASRHSYTELKLVDGWDQVIERNKPKP